MEFDNVAKVCWLCYHRISCHSQVVLLHQPTSHMIDSVLFLHVKDISRHWIRIPEPLEPV